MGLRPLIKKEEKDRKKHKITSLIKASISIPLHSDAMPCYEPGKGLIRVMTDALPPSSLSLKLSLKLQMVSLWQKGEGSFCLQWVTLCKASSSLASNPTRLRGGAIIQQGTLVGKTGNTVVFYMPRSRAAAVVRCKSGSEEFSSPTGGLFNCGLIQVSPYCLLCFSCTAGQNMSYLFWWSGEDWPNSEILFHLGFFCDTFFCWTRVSWRQFDLVSIPRAAPQWSAGPLLSIVEQAVL